MNDYKTISNDCIAEIVQHKSRFIARAAPAENEAHAIQIINEVKKTHSAASHHVYAYICRENNSQRYSDDGEPSGTAGVPVLEVLKKQGLTDACIVVTRYFGGTLLGTGGLLRAYGKAASSAVLAAIPINMIYSDVFEITTDYGALGKLQYEISESGFILLNSDFGENITLKVCTETNRSDELITRIADASLGKAHVKKVSTLYVARSMKGKNSYD